MLEVASQLRAALLYRRALVVALQRRVLGAARTDDLIGFADHVLRFVVDVHEPIAVGALLGLVAVPEPVVKVVSELLQDVHMVADRPSPLILRHRVALRLAVLVAALILEQDSPPVS